MELLKKLSTNEKLSELNENSLLLKKYPTRFRERILYIELHLLRECSHEIKMFPYSTGNKQRSEYKTYRMRKSLPAIHLIED